MKIKNNYIRKIYHILTEYRILCAQMEFNHLGASVF